MIELPYHDRSQGQKPRQKMCTYFQTLDLYIHHPRNGWVIWNLLSTGRRGGGGGGLAVKFVFKIGVAVLGLGVKSSFLFLYPNPMYTLAAAGRELYF